MADERRPNPPPEARANDEQGEASELEHDLDAPLADVKRERDEYLAVAQRARADFENYRKRAARETEEAERRGKASVARAMLPALDNLERALRSTGLDPATGQWGGAAEPTPHEQDAEAFDAPREEVPVEEGLAPGVALGDGQAGAALERAGV